MMATYYDKQTNGTALLNVPSSDKSSGIFNDPELEGLTLYEKKCVLINRELDSHGMGKYQWSIWGLCGFGYFLDLLWAMAFGLVLSPMHQEFGFPAAKIGNVSTSFSAGMTAGAFVWGVLVDIVGRKWAFNFTVFFSAIFGLALGGSNNYTTFLVLTAFIGFGIGGNIPIDTTITLEFIPQNRRFLLALLSLFQPLGVVVTTAIAYGFIPTYSCSPNWTAGDNALPSCNNVPGGQPCCGKSNNWGWRYLLLTLGAITFVVLIARLFVFDFKESPKFLVYRGREDEAIKVLQHIAKFNGTEAKLRLADFEALTAEHTLVTSDGSAKPILGGGALQQEIGLGGKLKLELVRYKMLFSSWTMARITILVWLTYICDYWGFTVAGTFLPTIISCKNAALNTSLRYTYRTYIYIYLPGIVGVLLGSLGYQLPFVGRKWTMVISSGLMGASLFIWSTINSEASNIGLNLMEYFFQSMFNAVLYGWTPEVFPAPIRGTASGIASFWGRLFGIVSPLIAAHLFAKNVPDGQLCPPPGSSGVNNVLYLAGGVTLGCVVFVALLPNKRVGAQSM